MNVRYFKLFKYNSAIAIRINKSYVAELNYLDSLELEIPEDNTLLSYNFFDYPKIRVSDGDKITIKYNYLSRVTYFTLAFTYILILFIAPTSLTWHPLFRIVFPVLIILLLLLPNYRFQKQ